MANLTQIKSYLALPGRIATSGQPTAEQFAEIQREGYEVVVNLAMPTSENWLPEERGIVSELGMDYVPLPVVWDYPTLDDFETLAEVLDKNRERPVWVHCALNMRVSAMMYLYHRLRLGMKDVEATGYLSKIWVPNDTWQKFMDAAIELYDD